MEYMHMRFPGGKTKAVTLSYDDGVAQDLRLAQTADSYGIKCTFNINSAFVPDAPGGGKLCWDEIKALTDRGHEAAVHGEYHRAPGAFPTSVGLLDALNCRIRMEAKLGSVIRGMAYPNSGVTRFTGGSDYETVRQYLKDIGVAYARTLGGDNNAFLLPEDWYRWTPTAHHGNPDVLNWAREFAALDVNKGYSDNRYPRLFYLWGHSYEFDRNGNWDLLEALCEILGGREDTWYAANIEICDYVRAFRSLVFGAECTRVYNPTATEVIFETENGLAAVPPGGTVAF